MDCKGKVALVTGAAGSGLGRSIALTLAREGAVVAVNYRTSQANAEEIVAWIESQGGQAFAVAGDVFTAGGCHELISAIENRSGQVDICVIGPGGGWHPEALDQLDPMAARADVDQEMAPIFHLLPLVLPGMYKRGWGRIIGIGTHLEKLSPAYAYNAAKAARTQALLLARDQAWTHGITVNVIAPGPVAPIASLEEATGQSLHGPAWESRINVSPQDIAEGVAFLCSDAGRFISGCVLPYLFF